jgi:hypothetical protein
MLRASFRVFFALVVSLSLAFGLFAGVGTSRAFAADQPGVSADGYNPVASEPVDTGYCYPSGYNRNGWRCGWRLAMAPYNLGDYYRYNYGYYYNPYYVGWGPTPVPPGGDYGGLPRYQTYYYYGPYYPTCYWYNGMYRCY